MLFNTGGVIANIIEQAKLLAVSVHCDWLLHLR
jgi:hypothetical protein